MKAMNKFKSVELYRPSGPLNKELLKKCDEIFCLAVLRTTFYPNFEGFELSDTPDLINNDENIGIEVTNAIDERDAAVIGEFSKHIYSMDERKKRISEAVIKKNNVILKDGMLSWPARNVNHYIGPLKKVICKKIEKIKKYKISSDKIGLMVFCETVLCPDNYAEWVDVYKRIDNGEKYFNFVFFLYGYGIGYYNPLTDDYNNIEIQKDDYDYLFMLARMISNGELSFESPEWRFLTKQCN